MDALDTDVKTDCAMCNLDTHKPISNKLRFIYIQLPYFNKTEEECQNIFEYCIYNIKNMETMNCIAFTQLHKIFKRLESVTNYANLEKAQRLANDEDLKIYRDFQNCMNFKLKEGLAKGRQKEQANVILKMAKSGMSAETIAQILEFPITSIAKILD